MRLNKLLVLSAFVLINTLSGFGQFKENIDPIEDYYIFPIKPGVRNSLSGTMGELRSNHFHSGIDVRTESRIGLPVHAAADGYVSRIAVSTSGYGNAVYLLHPNGETTVYAHLDHFTGELAEYIRQEQYRRKTFKLNLYFREGQFKVQQGDTIAFSGNSGSSGGPHLHFDIRDKNQKPLNPLSYGFEEILDNTPPVVRKLAIKTLNKEGRVNGAFGRYQFTPRRIGNNYVIDQPIEVSGQIGLELYAYDKLDNARFRCGINGITVNVGDQQTFKQTIETFSFGEQRNILAHMNYQQLYNSGERFHKLYVDDGNFLGFYKTDRSKGKLNIQEGDEREVKIAMTDTYGNKSYFTFKLKYGNGKKIIGNGSPSKKTEVNLLDNTLVIKTPKGQDASIQLANTDEFALESAYDLNTSTTVSLWDMREGLPDKLEVAGETTEFNFKNLVPSESSYQFYNEHVDISFPKRSLFDTLYLSTSHYYDTVSNREVFDIGTPLAPLRKNITVTFKSEYDHKNQSKTHVYFLNGSNKASYTGGKWEAGKITFRTRRFGKYTLLQDTIPPKITLIRADRETLRFKISDGLSGLNKFVCTVNGKWVLMNYDHKRRLIWSEKKDKSIPFKGEVKLLITDNANNKTTYTKTIQ